MANQLRNKPKQQANLQANDLDKTEEPMVLTKALDLIKTKYPWMPTWSLRQLVIEGKVPSYRSSNKKRAIYYVRMSDLLKALPRTGSE